LAAQRALSFEHYWKAAIVRWEKEGANYEAVIEKNGKQIGVEMDANGKVLSKHNEAKEHKEDAKY
jgi:hypothetical protein